MAAGDIALRILMTASAGNAIAAISQVAGVLGKGGLGGILAGVGIAAGAAAIALGVTAVKAAADFQTGLTVLATGAGESAANLQLVGNGIKQISIDTATSTQQLLSGAFMIESAGYHGADALNVLAVAAQGARLENADLGAVAFSLTGLLHDYGMSTTQASAAMNALIVTEASGKMHMQDLTTSLGNVLPLASTLKIAYPQIGAAIAVMTNANMTARRATQNLNFELRALSAPSATAVKAMQSVGLSAQQVKDTLSQQGLGAAIQLISDAVGKTFPAGSVEWVNAMKAINGGATGLNVALMLGGQHMKEYQTDVKNITAAMNNGKAGVMGWALVQQTFNFKMQQAGEALHVLFITIGQYLLPVLTNLMGLIAPLITRFAQWITSANGLQGIIHLIGDAFQQVFDPIQRVQQAAKPLLDTFDRGTGIIQKVWQQLTPLTDTFNRTKDAVLGVHTVLKPLTDTFDRASGVLRDTATHATAAHQAFNPFVALFQGIATTIRVVIVVFQTVATVVQTVAGFFQHYIWPVLQMIGSFLVATFTPVWKQLVSVWTTSILPSLKQLWGALQPLLPVLKLLAGIILGAVIIAIGIFVGVLGGLLKALAGLLQGVATVIGGMVQFFTGGVQIISGIIKFFVDLATGNFKNLGNDLHSIWNGIVNMFVGVWNVIKGIFQGAWNAISGFVSGLVSGVIGFFQHLAVTLVGHSIIPDMINAIVGWFLSLPGKALSAVGSLAGNLASFFGGIARNALTWGWNIISNLAGGIISGIGNALGNAMSSIGTFIHDHLPASPAKRGPLRDLQRQGALIPAQIAQGILAGNPAIGRALAGMLSPMAASLSGASLPGLRTGGLLPTGGSASGGTGSTGGPVSFTNHIYITAQHLDPNEINNIARQLGDKLRAQMGTI